MIQQFPLDLGPQSYPIGLRATQSWSCSDILGASEYQCENFQWVKHMIDIRRFVGYGLRGRPSLAHEHGPWLKVVADYKDHIISAGLFDAKFYAMHSPDVVEQGMDLLLHYLTYGHIEGRWPAPGFDSDFYRSEHLNGDKRQNPLIHYLVEGRDQSLPTSRAFSLESQAGDKFDMGAQNHSTSVVKQDDFRAFCTSMGIFDEAFYLSQNRDIDPEYTDAFDHFMTYGWSESRDPSRVFSLGWYRQTHLNGNTTINPLLHYYESGVYRSLSTTHGFNDGPDMGALRKLSQSGRFVYSENPEVTIVVVNFNGLSHLEDLVTSLSDLDYPSFRILMVDNGSTDGSVDWMQNNAPFVQLVKLTTNIGFADAVNLAVDVAPTQLVAFLNNDMAVDRLWLRELVEGLKASPQRAAVTSKILFFKPFVSLSLSSDIPFSLSPEALLKNHNYKKFFVERGRFKKERIESDADHCVAVKIPFENGVKVELHPEHIQSNGDFFGSFKIRVNGIQVSNELGSDALVLDPELFTDAGRWVINNAGSRETSEDIIGDRGFGEYDVGQYDYPENVPYLCGGSFIVNRTALHGRPIFIGDLFAYYEDTEMSVRLRQDGYRIGYAPGSIAYHKHASTSKENSVFFQRRVERNYSAFFARKCGLYRAQNQVSRKKSHLKHMSSYYTQQSNSTQRERELSKVYPEVITQLDDLYEAFASGCEFHGSHRTLRIGIYNSYWSTAGGGELHALNIGHFLSQFGVVDLIAESDFDLEKLLARFQLPRDRFRKVLIYPISVNDTAAYDVFVNSTFASNLVSKAAHSFYIVSFPHQSASAEMLESYTFLPNSLYTNHWCKVFWGERRTELLYPLVRKVVDGDNSISKEKIILNVGRFFPDGHSKMQHEIIKTFRELVKNHPEFEDWKLICIGGLDRDRKDCMEYFETVQSLAEGVNVELRPDASFADLNDLYRRAALYWHATGFGKSVDLEPYHFEHFGISTVEAMSAGCVPIVLDAGGQAEIVDEPAFGSRFKTSEQWISSTVEWMELFDAHPKYYSAASSAAREAAARYQSEAASQRMSHVFADVERADAKLHRQRPSSEFAMNGYWRFSGAP